MAVEKAIRSATAFLLAGRDGDGWWRDFNVAGPSDAWVTAYVGWTLAAVDDERAHQAAREAWYLLRARRRWGGGWGYHARVPGDADTTAWALRLADQVGDARRLAARRARRFLAGHVRPDGGVATYSLPGPIARFTGLAHRFSGWCSSHECVTAAAAAVERFPARPRLLRFLRERQREDGSWSGYWWHDPAYATALAVEALCRVGDRDDRRRVEAAAAWAVMQVGGDGAVSTPLDPSGSPFATAGVVRILATAAGREERLSEPGAIVRSLARASDWLLRAQGPQGGWRPSARLRIPPPDLADPDAFRRWGRDGTGEASIGTVVLDPQGLFTTATVLAALRAARIGLHERTTNRSLSGSG